MADWPWKENSSDRLRRIVDFYRVALQEADPKKCSIIDDKMVAWGQSWICSETIVDVNKLMSAREIAEEFGIHPWNVGDWSRRHPELIPKHKQGSATLFRVGDVLKFQASTGRR